MNIFIAGWNLTDDMQEFALNGLRRMVSTYPVLDPESLCSVVGPRVIAAVMHEKCDREVSSLLPGTSGAATGICFYDGCLVEPSGRFNAMNAQELSTHWNEIGSRVEGQFSAVRADVEAPFLEVRTDFLGMGQVYYWTAGGRWLLSNSVELIARTIGSADLDPLGVSLMLSLGWLPGDRTLHNSVRVLPSAAHWRWEGAGDEPVKVCDYPATRFWDLPRSSRFGRSEAAQLEATLVGICAQLWKQKGVLECPITGGRDSRVLVGLMMRGGGPTEYYSDAFAGNEEDIHIGQEIAKTLGLPYQVVVKDMQDLQPQWSSAVERLVRQNDGMVSLWQVADVLWGPRAVGSSSTRLWGIGGEIGRGNYDNPIWHYGLKTARFAKWFLARKVNQSELVTADSIDEATKFIDQWVDQKLDEGAPVEDIPDLFYAQERVRRWAGSNARKVRPWVDLFSPFCTRPFVNAAFALSPSVRFSEPIHYQLLRLHPELHRIPFASGSWRSQNTHLAMFNMIWEKKIRRVPQSHSVATSYQAILLEGNLKEVRDFCLAYPDSCVWNYVRRSLFESLLNAATPLETRQSRVPLLLQVLTLLHYEQLLRETVLNDSSARSGQELH
jgi:asparagine synthase (glutamine-hydrolysing)